MEHLDLVAGLLVSPGAEIGAFKTPIPGITPVYVDRFSEYANEPTMAEYFGDAADLPFVDSSLNYVATSHVIEHAANPLGAFLEWYRVLRHGGVIYMVVPNRLAIFDRTRALTTVDHIVQDYRNNVTQCDGTHIDDFVNNVDWKEFSPGTLDSEVPQKRQELQQSYQSAIESGSEINIHFHTFDPESMAELIQRANDVLPLNGGRINVERMETPFPLSQPNGFLVVARIDKPGSMPDIHPLQIFRADARKFDKPVKPLVHEVEWHEHNFPEESYLRLHPDVANAVALRQFESGYSHFQIFGRKEGRQVRY
ncbi:MAG: methyltransferase domain-containing protein [Pseudomonadota bacterium]